VHTCNKYILTQAI